MDVLMLNLKMLISHILDEMNKLVKGSVYTNFTYQSGFAAYATSGENAPTAYKCGRVVTLTGSIKPTTNQTTTGQKQLGKVPDACKPINVVRAIAHGSNQNIFLLIIRPDGGIWLERYGTTAAEVKLTTGNWLNINITYISAS